MKPLILLFFIFASLSSIGQVQRFTIQAKVINQNGEPISDVYIVNLVTNEKDISHNDGVFSIRVLPSDSIILSHISYFRKIVPIRSILLDPVVELFSEMVDIPEVKVTPDQQSDLDRATQNLKFLNEYNPPVKTRLEQEDPDPVLATMTEHNDQMRVEASSISFVRFSPSENIGKLFTKLKKKDRSNDYPSTRKQKEDIEKKELP